MISERKFSSLLAQIYEAAADFSRWPEALRAIAGAYNATTVVFGAVGANKEFSGRSRPVSVPNITNVTPPTITASTQSFPSRCPARSDPF